jgi:hypothetical protein
MKTTTTVDTWAISKVKKAYPEKSESWAIEQWNRAVDNIDVPVSSEVAVALLEFSFGIYIK